MEVSALLSILSSGLVDFPFAVDLLTLVSGVNLSRGASPVSATVNWISAA